MNGRLAGLALVVLGTALAAGCGAPTQAQSPPAEPPPPEVGVAEPVVATVTDYQDFPGRLVAINAVEVRARVTGYLEQVRFRDGATVKEGDVLCEIDPRPYQAELARAEGSVVQAQGRLDRLEQELARAKSLTSRKAITQEEIDRLVGDRTEAIGNLAVSKAVRDLAKLNLEFTKVRAPLSGRIGNRMLDPGNLVKADETPLTTIVSTNPIYAYFDLDERTMLRLKRLNIDWRDPEKKLPVLLGLADEEGFLHEGTIDFADNRVDAESGTWRLRGTFQSPDGLLTPGLFVRVRLPIGEPTESILVPEEALGTDQGQKFVYVVGAENKVEYRRIGIGRLHEGMRVVTEGLKPGEKIVVSGLQRARPNEPVTPVSPQAETAAQKPAQ